MKYMLYKIKVLHQMNQTGVSDQKLCQNLTNKLLRCERQSNVLKSAIRNGLFVLLTIDFMIYLKSVHLV